MADGYGEGDGELSFALPDESTLAGVSRGNETFDLTNLADFEDEAALLNELLTASSLDDSLADSLNGNNDINEGVLSLLELDAKLARLLSLLEHASSDTSSQVERGIEDVSRAVPRLTFDLQLMRENVTLLRFTLDSIRKRSIEATAHNETSKVMHRLKVLDTIKTRMEGARDVLREAEAWSTLESEVTALVQEQSYLRAAERLAEANKSMIVFQNTPEYEARRSLMVSLQNGLEAGLSASLVSAINARDIMACKKYYAIFGQIQRETEFRNYYFGSRRAGLLKEWQAARLSDCLDSSSYSFDTDSIQRSLSSSKPLANTFSNYLPTFYTNLQAAVDDERTYIPSIFPDPLDTLSNFLQSTLESLIPSFPQRISDLSNSHGPRLLLEIIKIYQSTEGFAVMVDRIFSRLAMSLNPPTASPVAMLSPADVPATPGKLSHSGSSSPATLVSGQVSAGMTSKHSQQQRSRRLSKTMSISRRHSRGGLNPFSHTSSGAVSFNPASGTPSTSAGIMLPDEQDRLRAWETSLFEPFLDWQAEYSDLESRLLRSELASLTAGQDAMIHLLSFDSSASGDDDDGLDDEGIGTERLTTRAGASARKGGAKILLEQTLSVFSLAEDALTRTMAFTHGYGAAGFVEAVDGTFKTFLLRQRDTLLSARASRSRRRGTASSARAVGQATGASRDEEISMDYSQQDWATFQLALRLLETCKTIWERIAGLEQKVRTRLLDVARMLREARQDPLNQLVPGTTKGALNLLWQSTLNSANLVTLLESAEQQSQHSHDPMPYTAPLFVQARSANIDLTRASQLYLHDTILGPIMLTLGTYSSLAAWNQSSESRPEARGAFDLHIPTFSLSPSETITRIGEGLFNLPGMFEVYAEDDALGFSLETLPGLDSETVKTLRKEHGSMLGPSNGQHQLSPQPSPNIRAGSARHRSSTSVVGNEFLPSPMYDQQRPQQQVQNGQTAPAPVTWTSPSISHHSSFSVAHPLPFSQSSNNAHHNPLSAETVISTWLSSLTRSVLLHLTSDVLPSIQSLTGLGADQLASDLGYLSNVARALDVEDEQVEKWRNALDYTSEQSRRLGTMGDLNDLEPGLQLMEDNEVVDLVKRMRARSGIRAA